jgi:hypothetical protein
MPFRSIEAKMMSTLAFFIADTSGPMPFGSPNWRSSLK